MRPLFKSCALLKNPNNHVYKDTVCNPLYSKVTVLLLSIITYIPQNREALLVFFMFATKCWDGTTLSALWRAGALTLFFVNSNNRLHFPTTKTSIRKTIGKRSKQNDVFTADRSEAFICQASQERGETPSLTDWWWHYCKPQANELSP